MQNSQSPLPPIYLITLNPSRGSRKQSCHAPCNKQASRLPALHSITALYPPAQHCGTVSSCPSVSVNLPLAPSTAPKRGAPLSRPLCALLSAPPALRGNCTRRRFPPKRQIRTISVYSYWDKCTLVHLGTSCNCREKEIG